MSNLVQHRDGSTVSVEQPESWQNYEVLIEVLGVAASPRSRLLTKGALVMGAGLGADIVIDDAGVSRRHAQVSVTERGVEIIDLGSRNGTRYEGQRFERITLKRDSIVVLGTVRVRMSLLDKSAERVDLVPLRLAGIVGECPAMKHVGRVLDRLRGSLVPALIVGESGTGKELVAHAIHEQSSLREGPFQVVDCGALDSSTARAVLFGNFDGTIGVFESASGGTVFLDEVGELPLPLQALLLRFLDASVIQRVGEVQERKLTVRVVASTRHNLAQRVQVGEFREDLLFRLNVLKVELPALREREGDLLLLVRHFAAEFGVSSLSEEVLSRLKRYRWPGNVRELRNVLRGYAVLGELPEPEANTTETGFDQLLRKALDLKRPYQEQKEELLNKFIEVYLAELLRRTNGNQSEAARIAGIDRAHLNKMVAKMRKGAIPSRKPSEPPVEPNS